MWFADMLTQVVLRLESNELSVVSYLQFDFFLQVS